MHFADLNIHFTSTTLDTYPPSQFDPTKSISTNLLYEKIPATQYLQSNSQNQKPVLT